MNEKKKPTIKQIIVFSLFAAIGSVVGSFAYNYFVSGSFSGPSTVQRALLRTANETNKSLPIVLDQHTRLDTTIAGGGNQFTYLYTLINIDPDLFDSASFIAEMKPRLIKQYETHADMKAFRDMNVELTYCYRSEEGAELVNIKISPDEFTKNKI